MQEKALDSEPGFKDYISVLKRHSKLFFWTLAPIVTVGVGIAFGLPAIYKSSGTIPAACAPSTRTRIPLARAELMMSLMGNTMPVGLVT